MCNSMQCIAMQCTAVQYGAKHCDIKVIWCNIFSLYSSFSLILSLLLTSHFTGFISLFYRHSTSFLRFTSPLISSHLISCHLISSYLISCAASALQLHRLLHSSHLLPFYHFAPLISSISLSFILFLIFPHPFPLPFSSSSSLHYRATSNTSYHLILSHHLFPLILILLPPPPSHDVHFSPVPTTEGSCRACLAVWSRESQG